MRDGALRCEVKLIWPFAGLERLRSEVVSFLLFRGASIPLGKAACCGTVGARRVGIGRWFDLGLVLLAHNEEEYD